jgi:uncharacterized membrane protein HdeD (DUF308 family)
MVTRGLASVMFGIAAFALMASPAMALILLLASYLLVNGVLALIGPGGHSWAMKVGGAVDLLGSTLVFAWPGICSLLPTMPVAAWALVAGLIQVLTALHLNGLVLYPWPLLLAGITTIVLAIVLAAYRGSSLTSCFALMGEYAVVWGEFALIMGIGLVSARGRSVRMG